MSRKKAETQVEPSFPSSKPSHDDISEFEKTFRDAHVIKNQSLNLGAKKLAELLSGVDQKKHLVFEKCDLKLPFGIVVLNEAKLGELKIRFRDCHLHLRGDLSVDNHCSFSSCTFDSGETPWQVTLGDEPEIDQEGSSWRGWVHAQGCQFVGVDLCVPNGGNLQSSKMVSTTLSGTWRKAHLDFSELDGCLLKNTHFEECHLDYVKTTDLIAHAEVSFGASNVEELEIDRICLEGIRDRGGLTHKQLRSMRIRDDLAKLSALYSGFNLWVHLWAILSFLAPFVLFVSYELGESAVVDLSTKLSEEYGETPDKGGTANGEERGDEGEKTGASEMSDQGEMADKSEPPMIGRRWFQEDLQQLGQNLKDLPRESLLWQLAQFAWMGGRPKATGWSLYAHRFMMMVILVYNFGRLWLLQKTLSLEHEQRITGVQSSFNFREHPLTSQVYSWSRYTMAIYFIACGINLVFFCMTLTPT